MNIVWIVLVTMIFIYVVIKLRLKNDGGIEGGIQICKGIVVTVVVEYL